MAGKKKNATFFIVGLFALEICNEGYVIVPNKMIGYDLLLYD